MWLQYVKNIISAIAAKRAKNYCEVLDISFHDVMLTSSAGKHAFLDPSMNSMKPLNIVIPTTDLGQNKFFVRGYLFQQWYLKALLADILLVNANSTEIFGSRDFGSIC